MEKEEDINNEIVSQLMSGKRPENMSFDEFKIKRKAIESYLKRRNKGTYMYISKEVDFITDEEGKKKKVIKSYGPYRKSKNENTI